MRAPDGPGRPPVLVVDSEVAGELIAAAEALRAARVRYAEAFLRHRLRSGATDGQATQQAIIETGGELTVLEARLLLAEQEVRHAAEPARSRPDAD